jgi:hypothetical protein
LAAIGSLSIREADVPSLYSLHWKISYLNSLAELWIARRGRVVIKKEGTADSIRSGAGLAVVFDRKVDRVDKIGISRPASQAPKNATLPTTFMHEISISKPYGWFPCAPSSAGL